MKAIETTIIVASDHTATLQLPDDILPGRHAAVILVQQDEASIRGEPFVWPTREVGPWPTDFSLRREDLYGDDGR